MTDRRIDRTVASHLAALEARVRELETVLGGGTSRETAKSYVPGFFEVASTSYGDPPPGNPPPGPSVEVNVGRVGVVQFYVSATIELEAQDTAGQEEAGANIALELSGANVLSADAWTAAHGFMNSYVRVSGTGAGSDVVTAVSLHRVWTIEDLDPGLTTATMKYRLNPNPGASKVFIYERELLAIPL